MFLGEVVERSSDMCKVLNEPAIEVGESEEAVQLLEIARRGPAGNGSDFGQVHGYFPASDDEPQIFDFFLFKFAFFWSKVEVMCMQML